MNVEDPADTPTTPACDSGPIAAGLPCLLSLPIPFDHERAFARLGTAGTPCLAGRARLPVVGSRVTRAGSCKATP